MVGISNIYNMKHINSFRESIVTDKDESETLEDYFQDWIDQRKWGIELKKTRTVYKRGTGLNDYIRTDYTTRGIKVKAQYLFVFVVNNNPTDIYQFISELNNRVERFNLTYKIINVNPKTVSTLTFKMSIKRNQEL